MRGKDTTWKLLAGTVALAALAGCRATPPYVETARRLDRIERYLEQWGTATVSQIVLQPADDDRFKIEFAQDAGVYVDKARQGFQGSAGRLLERVFAGRLQAQLRNAAEGEETPEASAPEGREPVRESLSQERFLGARDLIESPQAISEGDAVKIGLSQKLTEMLLLSLTDLKDMKARTGYTPYFGVCQVSCKPGWQTSKGYAAEVSVATEFYTNREKLTQALLLRQVSSLQTEIQVQQAEEIREHLDDADIKDDNPLPMNKVPPGILVDLYGVGVHQAPPVLAILPMVEAQTLDLSNSQRDEVALSLALEGLLTRAGLNTAAGAFADYVSRLQFDAATRSARPTILSHSGDTSFGFEFRPSLGALEDPSDPDSVSEVTLQPYTIPALVVVLLDSTDIEIMTDVRFVQTTRWKPMHTSGWFAKTFWYSWTGGDPYAALHTEERVEIAEELDNIHAAMDEWEKGSSSTTNVSLELRSRYRLLESLGRSQVQDSLLPSAKKPNPPQPPLITSVSPGKGFRNAVSTFVISGNQLPPA